MRFANTNGNWYVLEKDGWRAALAVKCSCCGSVRVISKRKAKARKTDYCLGCWRTKENPKRLKSKERYLPKMGRDTKGKFISYKDSKEEYS